MALNCFLTMIGRHFSYLSGQWVLLLDSSLCLSREPSLTSEDLISCFLSRSLTSSWGRRRPVILFGSLTISGLGRVKRLHGHACSLFCFIGYAGITEDCKIDLLGLKDPQKWYELTLYDKYCNSQLILSRKMFIWHVFTDRGQFTDIWTVWTI